MKELGIYVHIPFCKRKCDYCDFVSYAQKDDIIEKYINSVIKEIDYVSNKIIKEQYNINTIYIGGGTPSYIDSKYIKMILSKIKQKFKNNIDEKIEITIEINPGTVNEEKLLEYKNTGINRISIGVQSTSDRLLKEIGRIHTFEEFLEIYNMARKKGFSNINIDMILGLPGQTEKDIDEMSDVISKLNPEHVSVYSLILEEGTCLYQKVKKGIAKLADEDIERQMYWKTKKNLESIGYKHYEISNFAKPGFESKHNLNCWKQKEYIGIGLSAHSYLDNSRFSNISDLEKYIENIQNDEYEKNKIIHEVQNEEIKQKEFVMLGLRMIDGVSILEFSKKFGKELVQVFNEEINRLIEKNLIEITEPRIKLTEKGLDFANIVWQEFV